MIYFKLWVLDFTKPNRAHTCYQSHVGNESPILGISRKYREIPLQYRDFPLLKSDFPHTESDFPHTKSSLPKLAFYFIWRLSAFFNGFPLSPMAIWLSSTAFRFLQRLSEFLRRVSDFPHRLSAFREIRENLFTAASIRKITIRASYFPPLAGNRHLLPKLCNCHSLPELRNCHSLPELRNRYNACISPNTHPLQRCVFFLYLLLLLLDASQPHPLQQCVFFYTCCLSYEQANHIFVSWLTLP
jgi:hypothetical protein